MCVSTCVYEWMYVCICVYMYGICGYECKNVWLYICVGMYVCKCFFIYNISIQNYM